MKKPDDQFAIAAKANSQEANYRLAYLLANF